MLKEKLGGRWSLKILNYFNCLKYVFLKVFYNLAIIILTWTLIKKKLNLSSYPSFIIWEKYIMNLIYKSSLSHGGSFHKYVIQSYIRGKTHILCTVYPFHNLAIHSWIQSTKLCNNTALTTTLYAKEEKPYQEWIHFDNISY